MKNDLVIKKAQFLDVPVAELAAQGHKENKASAGMMREAGFVEHDRGELR